MSKTSFAVLTKQGQVRQQTYRKGLPEFACMPERRRDYVVS